MSAKTPSHHEDVTRTTPRTLKTNPYHPKRWPNRFDDARYAHASARTVHVQEHGIRLTVQPVIPGGFPRGIVRPHRTSRRIIGSTRPFGQPRSKQLTVIVTVTKTTSCMTTLIIRRSIPELRKRT